jgi:hypothetical protein
MDKRNFVSLMMTAVLAVVFGALLFVGPAISEDDRPGSRSTERSRARREGYIDDRSAGGQEERKQDLKTEFPPGWEQWDSVKRQQWRQGLSHAKNAVRKYARARLDAALHSLEAAARQGVAFDDAENMAMAGLDGGLEPLDFEPLGEFVVEKVKGGLKGRELTEAIHEEIDRRQQQKRKLHEESKEEVEQSSSSRKQQREELKKDHPGGSSEEQEENGRRSGRSRPGSARGRAEAVKEKKEDNEPE